MITPPCDSPGCKQPSVHLVAPLWPRRKEVWPPLHLCVLHYERKVWGKA